MIPAPDCPQKIYFRCYKLCHVCLSGTVNATRNWNKHPKIKNLRIGIFSLLSSLDFGCLARNSNLQLPQAGCESVTSTSWAFMLIPKTFIKFLSWLSQICPVTWYNHNQLHSLCMQFFEPHMLGNPPVWLHTAHTVNSNGFSHSAFHFLTNSCW